MSRKIYEIWKFLILGVIVCSILSFLQIMERTDIKTIVYCMMGIERKGYMIYQLAFILIIIAEQLFLSDYFCFILNNLDYMVLRYGSEKKYLFASLAGIIRRDLCFGLFIIAVAVLKAIIVKEEIAFINLVFDARYYLVILFFSMLQFCTLSRMNEEQSFVITTAIACSYQVIVFWPTYAINTCIWNYVMVFVCITSIFIFMFNLKKRWLYNENYIE